MKRALVVILVVILMVASSCGAPYQNDGMSSSELKTPTSRSEVISATTSGSSFEDSGVNIDEVLSSVETEEEAYSLSDYSTCTVSITDSDARLLRETVRKTEVVYEQAALFELGECARRLQEISHVVTHPKSALNDSFSNLAQIVAANNAAYMQTKPMLVELPEDGRLQEVCRVLSEYIPIAVRRMRAQGVTIDQERVKCTLSDLKIIHKPGMLDFASVTKERILYISESSEEIVTNLYGENAYRDTLVHEAMHLIQLGCPCESDRAWERRAGIAYSYDNFPMNSLDWAWYPEAIAEHTMSLVTGDEPITYATYLKYLNSLHLATLPNTDVAPHAVDAVGFESDPQALFSLLSDDVLSQEECLCMMTALNMVLNEPDVFLESYSKLSGKEVSVDNEAYQELMYSMEADVCATLSKCFYVHLFSLLTSEAVVSAEDLACLLNVFESTMNQHLRFTKQEYSLYNESFLDTYTVLRDALLESVTMSNGKNFSEFYASYVLTSSKNTINASLHWMDEEGRAVLYRALEALAYSAYPKVP